jgi:hypothetical protein
MKNHLLNVVANSWVPKCNILKSLAYLSLGLHYHNNLKTHDNKAANKLYFKLILSLSLSRLRNSQQRTECRVQ